MGVKRDYGMQSKVCEMLLLGKCAKDIARMFDCSVRNVKFHIENIYRKNNVHSQAEFMAIRIDFLEQRIDYLEGLL